MDDEAKDLDEVSPSNPFPTAFTISFDDDDGDTGKARKSLDIKDPIRQFAPRKSFERSSRRSTKSSPANNFDDGPDSIESNPTMNSLPLTDSATYLINKMFSSQETSPDASNGNIINYTLDPSARGPVVLPDNQDDDAIVASDPKDIETLSESGTYTLGLEKKNAALENARKMIDNVFGVPREPTTSRQKSPSPQFRSNLGSGSVPSSPRPSRVSAGADSSNYSGSESDLKQRTFTRSKTRRGSLKEAKTNKQDNRESSSERTQFNVKKLSSNSNRENFSNLPRNRYNSCSSSKSGSSNRTVDVKKPINGIQSSSSCRIPVASPQPNRKSFLYSSQRRTSNDSFGSEESEEHPKDESTNPSGLKLNRAFALRRARLGIETPGVSVTLTDEKQKKNQEKRAREDRSSRPFSRDDGGRFSLRVTKGKPPLPLSCPATPKKVRDANRHGHHGRYDQPRLSPASSTNSVSNGSFVQRGSYGAASPQYSSGQYSLPSHSRDLPDRVMRNMNAFQVSKRMFSTKPHQQQQVSSVANDVRNRQQANVAPMKRMPCNQHHLDNPSYLPVMTSSLHEQSIRSEPAEIFEASNSRPQPNIIQRRTLSSLDNLVVSAIVQLSLKIRRGMREWLESEKLKHPSGSETRLMIEEILPQVSNVEPQISMSSFDNSLSCNENLSKDLSTILRNLKKVEESLAVISALTALEPSNYSTRLELAAEMEHGKNAGHDKA